MRGMLTAESNRWDRIFVALLAVAVIGTLLGLRLWADHLQANKAAISTPSSAGVLKLEAIEHVYECERDGKRIVTDRPCGAGVRVRVHLPSSQAEIDSKDQ
jgi:hypothetical protein